MNCKHKKNINLSNNNAKKQYCKAKDKLINKYDCEGCMLKLPDLPKGFEKLFGKGFEV